MRQNKGKRKSSEDLVVTSVKRLNAKSANGNRKRKQPHPRSDSDSESEVNPPIPLANSFGGLSETVDKDPSPLSVARFSVRSFRRLILMYDDAIYM